MHIAEKQIEEQLFSQDKIINIPLKQSIENKTNLSEEIKKHVSLKKTQNLIIFDGAHKVLLNIGQSNILYLGKITSTSQPKLMIWQPEEKMAEMSRWAKSFYFIEEIFQASNKKFTKLSSISTNQTIQKLNALRLPLLALLLLFSLLGIFIASFLSYLLTSSLSVLNKASRTMAENISKGYAPKLPQMLIAEFIELSKTQTKMGSTILSNFTKIQAMQTNLEARVKEQTASIISQKRRLDDIIIATNTGIWEWNPASDEVTISNV